MSKKKIPPLRDAHTIAMELFDVRRRKNELAFYDKQLSKELKEAEDFKDQTIFTYQSVVAVEIKDYDVALKWVHEHAPQLLEINTTKAKKLFAMDLKIPEGFDTKIIKKLVITGDEPEE